MSTDITNFSPKTHHYHSHQDAVNQNRIYKVQIEESDEYVYMFRDEFYFWDTKTTIAVRRFAHKDLHRGVVLQVWKSNQDYFFRIELAFAYGGTSANDIFAVYRTAAPALERLNGNCASLSLKYPTWLEITDIDANVKAVEAKFE